MCISFASRCPASPMAFRPLVARIALFVSKLVGSFEAICFDPNIMWPLRFAFGVANKKFPKMSPGQIGNPKNANMF